MESSEDILNHWPRVSPGTSIDEAAEIALENEYGAVIVEADGCPKAVVVAPELFRWMQEAFWGLDDFDYPWNPNDPELLASLCAADEEYERTGGVDGDEVRRTMRRLVGLEA